jgi:ferredoxin/flavodoxin---NADP+ reductase
VIKGPETYDRFEKIVLLHGCRRVSELAYGEMITESLPPNELIREQLIYYPTVTRDPFHNRGRITDLITSSKLFSDISLPNLDAAKDRVMICGSPALLTDTKFVHPPREGIRGGPSRGSRGFCRRKGFRGAMIAG